MDILGKIESLRKQREWSIYKLAEQSGVMQSTLSNMFARKTMPSIQTLSMLCSAFGITMSEFFEEDTNNMILNENEKNLIKEYRLLNNKNKDIASNIIKLLK